MLCFAKNTVVALSCKRLGCNGYKKYTFGTVVDAYLEGENLELDGCDHKKRIDKIVLDEVGNQVKATIRFKKEAPELLRLIEMWQDNIS